MNQFEVVYEMGIYNENKKNNINNNDKNNKNNKR